jgi:2-isopropylmalate synthase
MIDCEHFFDGWKGNRAYALAVATTAYKAGARWVVLCGHQRRHAAARVSEIVTEVAKRARHALGIHTHNDTENAVANTLRPCAPARARSRAAQWAGRALRQRQSGSIIPTCCSRRVRRPLRHAGDAAVPREAHPRQPAA